MLWSGLFIQGVSLIGFSLVSPSASVFASGGLFWMYLILAALLGTGTAMVYPTFLAAIGDLTHPVDRAESVGVFRLWRDGGYALGAIFAGVIADRAGLELTVLFTGVLVLFSGVWLLVRYRA